jgi:DNA-binding MarR family transcriptional regulator
MAEHRPKLLATFEAVKLVSQILHARRTRSDFFAPKIFSDPAWDMLLVLFLAKVRGEGMPRDQLAKAASSPLSTSDRWIDVLERDGLLQLRRDPSDPETEMVELAPKGWSAMLQWAQRWFESCPENGSERTTELLNRIYDDKI